MLEAGRAPEVHNGLVVFHDHADPNLRYVAAEVPRVERRRPIAIGVESGP